MISNSALPLYAIHKRAPHIYIMAESTSPPRVRFAPSPTGLLHIGGLRTALYNYLFARKHGGQFILRIEDTDQKRYVEEAEPDILHSLDWAGLEIDEGPGKGGEVGPYRQSERSETYRRYARQLVEDGHAYYAFDTPEELEAMRERFKGSGDAAPKYDAVTRSKMKNSLTIEGEEVQKRLDSGEPYVIRLKVPRRESVRFEDQIHGWVSFDAAGLDDQVLLKSDGLPTYHLANVVDDHLMEITHVIRGEEWVSSTPKHVLLYEFLGWEPPEMAHLPLILSPQGGKLSKRDANELNIPVWVRDYREEGYEPEALLNFLAFLGWNPGDERELFSLGELAEAFSIDRVGASGVQFNQEKLEWYNQQHIQRMDDDELARRARPFLEEQGYDPADDYLREVVGLVRSRIDRVADVAQKNDFFFSDPASYDEEGVKKRWKDDSADLLRDYADRLESVDSFDEDTVEQVLRELADERDAGAGRIIHPTRLAVSGRHYGPSLFSMMVVLGKDACLRRMRRAAEELG